MPLIRRSSKNPIGMGTFKRGMTISPFQIPLMVYLFLEGLLVFFQVHSLAVQLDVHDWVIWNFAGALVVGAGLATFSRFNENERLETLGLMFIFLAVVISGIVSVYAHDYNLGDELAIGTGCLVRGWVLYRSRKAEKVAIKISGENNDEGETY